MIFFLFKFFELYTYVYALYFVNIYNEILNQMTKKKWVCLIWFDAKWIQLQKIVYFSKVLFVLVGFSSHSKIFQSNMDRDITIASES